MELLQDSFLVVIHRCLNLMGLLLRHLKSVVVLNSLLDYHGQVELRKDLFLQNSIDQALNTCRLPLSIKQTSSASNLAKVSLILSE